MYDKNLNLVMFNFDGKMKLVALTNDQYRLLSWLSEGNAFENWVVSWEEISMANAEQI